MKKLTILIDMDDTIEGLLPAWVEYLNNRYGTTVSPDDVKEWDITKAFPELSEHQVFEPFLFESFWENVKPLPGAQEVIKRLMDDGHDVYIVTSTCYKIIEMKMDKVLFKYFPFIDHKKLIITYNKQLLLGDVMIDDAPHNLIGGCYKKLLIDSPTNRSVRCDSKSELIRMHSWYQIYDYIQTL